MKRLISFLAAALIIISVSGCNADITNSTKYETHELKYIVNLTAYEGDPANVIEELKNVLKERLNEFKVAEVEITDSTENDLHYLNVKFGTIDNTDDILKLISRNSTFSIKKKIKDESDYENDLREKAKATLEKIKNGANFELTAQNDVLSDPERIFYSHADWMYQDEIKAAFKDIVFDLEPGAVYPEIIEYNERPFALAAPIKIASIVKLFDQKQGEQVVEHPKLVDANHILVAYKGAMRAPEETTRTKEEAETLINEVKEKLNNNEDFSALALDYSDDPSNNASGGYLENPAGKGGYVEEFETAALKLNEIDEISDVVESPFGYHIIKARGITEAYEETLNKMQATFGVIFYALRPAEWEPTDLIGNRIKSINTLYDETYDPHLIVQLDEEGTKILEELTKTNDEILGIFSGDEVITSFTVKEVISDGKLKIMAPINTKEADTIIDKLNLKVLPVPIVLIEELS
jgi:hypothetical protein